MLINLKLFEQMFATLKLKQCIVYDGSIVFMVGSVVFSTEAIERGPMDGREASHPVPSTPPLGSCQPELKHCL